MYVVCDDVNIPCEFGEEGIEFVGVSWREMVVGCLMEEWMNNDDVESECWNGRWAEEEENVQEVHVPWNRSGQAAGHVP